MGSLHYNSGDLLYIKKFISKELYMQIKKTSEHIDYVSYLGGRHANKLKKILSGEIQKDNLIKREVYDYKNYVYAPFYSDEDVIFFQKFGIRNLSNFQNQSGFSKITLIINKVSTVEDVSAEISYIREVLKKDVSFLIDSNISMYMYKQILVLLTQMKEFKVRILKRSEEKTKKMLSLLLETNFKVHLGSFRTNLSASAKKWGKNIPCIIPFYKYRNVINSYSRGIFLPPPDSEGYILYNFNSNNASISKLDKIGESEIEYGKNRYEYANNIQNFLNQFSHLSENEFINTMKGYGIQLKE